MNKSHLLRSAHPSSLRRTLSTPHASGFFLPCIWNLLNSLQQPPLPRAARRWRTPLPPRSAHGSTWRQWAVTAHTDGQVSARGLQGQRPFSPAGRGDVPSTSRGVGGGRKCCRSRPGSPLAQGRPFARAGSSPGSDRDRGARAEGTPAVTRDRRGFPGRAMIKARGRPGRSPGGEDPQRPTGRPQGASQEAGSIPAGFNDP